MFHVKRSSRLEPGLARKMNDIRQLATRLRALDGQGYRALKSIRGTYDAGTFRLAIDHVQGDPFADPSRLRAIVPATTARLPEWAIRSRTRRVAAADFLNRVFAEVLEAESKPHGSGHSGELSILRPGQQVLERSSLRIDADGCVEARFRAGLPADGRRILGHAAAELLTSAVPAAVERALRFDALDADALRLHVETVEDACALRAALEPNGLVAFIADGACLPRRSGVDDRPLSFDRVVPFRSPDSMRVTLRAPNAGEVTGMGVPQGVTLIVGGGYHGKSTVLRALEQGVYDHIPGDGRERVVTVDTAVKVRAEEGRSIAGTDVSNFIGALPGGGDSSRLRTANASGSTSQAAAMIEALEVGATCLLLDEDSSATNLLIRDARMQALVPADLEPITPLIDQARNLFEDQGVSTILVLGGSGDYFDVASTVIALHAYVPEEVTARAREIAAELPTQRRPSSRRWAPISPRVPLARSLDPRRGRRDVHIKVLARDRVQYGPEEADLRAVEQLVERAQSRAVAEAVAWAWSHAFDDRRTLPEALRFVMDAIREHGLDAVHPEPIGELAAFRIFELAAFLNRIRSLRVR